MSQTCLGAMELSKTVVRPSRSDAGLGQLRLAFVEARPVVQVIFLIRFCAAALLAAPDLGPARLPRLLAMATAWFATTWVIYLINGIADVAADRLNGSRRPIAQGLLPINAATRIAAALVIVALALAALVSPLALVVVVLMLAVGWFYSFGRWPAKNHMPAFVVSAILLGLLTYSAGAIAIGATRISGALAVFAIALSLWMGLGGWTKDLSDTEGDALTGRRTLPVILGDRLARTVMSASASIVGWGFVVSCAVWQRWLLPEAAVLCIGSAILSVVALASGTSTHRAVNRRPYRIFMITQYLTHAVLVLSIIVKIANHASEYFSM